MMGKLIWLMGPSGSGKDSLLAELRLREQTQLLVAHRYITRDASAGSENHIALSEREFFTRAGQNLLALSWHANGLYYGVGIEIDLWLHAGFDVVVNGSRAHLPQARARYQSALLPVCLQVSPEILRQRLENRGRENASEINARLARAARYTPQDCHTLNNDGSLRQSVDTLLTLIHQKKKHHAFRVGFNANLRDPNMRYHLALLDGEVVGMIGLHLQFHLHHVNWIGEIQELVVMPQARGLNVGSKLLAWAEEEARQAGAEMTELSTNVKRHDAHRFYLREGYEQSHFRFTKAL